MTYGDGDTLLEEIKELEERIKLGVLGLELLAENCPCGGKTHDPKDHVTNCLVMVTIQKLKYGPSGKEGKS